MWQQVQARANCAISFYLLVHPGGKAIQGRTITYPLVVRFSVISVFTNYRDEKWVSIHKFWILTIFKVIRIWQTEVLWSIILVTIVWNLEIIVHLKMVDQRCQDKTWLTLVGVPPKTVDMLLGNIKIKQSLREIWRWKSGLKPLVRMFGHLFL